MDEVQSMGFFIISLIAVVSIAVCFATLEYISKYRQKRMKEQKELEEAAKMFEQRIALRPKHMGARLGMGVAGDVHFESVDSRKE